MITKIIQYESGELNDQQTLELFCELIKSGLCWQLQGSYGRMAKQLIDKGIIDENGKQLIEL